MAKFYYVQLGPYRRLIAVRKGGAGMGLEVRGADGPSNLDASTELYFYNARYYDAHIGRFTQLDTIVPRPADPQSLNRYSYVLNNPLKYVDPTGHDEGESSGGFVDHPGGDHGGMWVPPASGTGSSGGSGGSAGSNLIPTQVPVPVATPTSEQIQIDLALDALLRAGGWSRMLYWWIQNRKTKIQFGGAPFGIFRLPGSSTGHDNVIYLDENLLGRPAPLVAAFIAHELYHAVQNPNQNPFSKAEEVQAFAQEARAWTELRVMYKTYIGSEADPAWTIREAVWIRYMRDPEGLSALVDYVANDDMYRWFPPWGGCPRLAGRRAASLGSVCRRGPSHAGLRWRHH